MSPKPIHVAAQHFTARDSTRGAVPRRGIAADYGGRRAPLHRGMPSRYPMEEEPKLWPDMTAPAALALVELDAALHGGPHLRGCPCQVCVARRSQETHTRGGD